MKFKLLFIAICLFLCNCKDSKKTSESPNNESVETATEQKISEADFSALSTQEKIAYKSGFTNWEKVNELKFTFNVDRGENHSERSWTWMPKTNDVVLITETDTVSYNRNNLNEETKKSDAAFINDQFWLLAPFNLAWDSSINFSEEKQQIAPISKQKMDKLTAVYVGDGGYTPGDAYDFYYDDEYFIREWTYRNGNSTEPSMSTTWENYQNFDIVNIAKMHKDATGDFKLYFTGISIK